MGDFQAKNFRRPQAGVHTVEGNVAGSRAADLAKKRQLDQLAFEQRKEQIVTEAQGGKHRQSIGAKFTGATSSFQEQTFREKTVGLVTADDFRALQAEASSEQRLGASGEKQETESERAGREKASKKARKKKLKEKKKMMATLSFAGNDEEEGDFDKPEKKEQHVRGSVTSGTTSKKDPTIDTSFLPDKDRDERVQAERQRLEREWKEQQERIRQEKLEIVYSYWDGSGHRRTAVCRKGDSIAEFLEIVRKDLSGEFKELAKISSDALIYVKEDLILPQDCTFYDLIATKARGKSGPLFHFDVHDDVRIGAIDSRIEKDESHPGKVIERRWYERNKHIFPASRWEIYDPTKDYGKYTIGGS
jgi:protein FAM50